jgi:hypothetical protein
MYGVNWVTVLGKVLTDPVLLRFNKSTCLAYLVDGSHNSLPSPGHTRGVCIWCFSIDFECQVAQKFDLHYGDYVMMYGALFKPSGYLIEQVGAKHWSLALSGKPLASLNSPSFKGHGAQRTSMALVTGRVLAPGATECIAKSSNRPYIQFSIHHEGDVYRRKKWWHFEGDVRCCYNILDGSEDVIVPGAVLLCRGGLLNWGPKNRVWMWCEQIESLGVVTRKLMEFEQKKNTRVPGSGRKPRWRAAARAAMLAEKREAKIAAKLAAKGNGNVKEVDSRRNS